MSTEQLQKPDFFEGQYLGAADLDLAVDYNRYQLARHELGAHTWGVVSGLALTEVPAADGETVSVYVSPGLAVDGYGRQITVLEPSPIPVNFFTSFTKPAADGEVGMRVRVWVRYAGTAFKSPAPGFENCDADTFSRVQDEFVVEVGPRSRDQEHETVVISGADVHALEVVDNRPDDEPLWCDESIAYQTFPPSDQDKRWLIPLGVVRWDPDTQKLIPTTEDDRRQSRVYRHYAGSVTEQIVASNGLIRLRRRESEPPTDPTKPLQEACESALRVGDPNDDYSGSDLLFDEGRVTVEDLVWVEGNLRAKGDIKLFGTKLDLRNTVGSADGVPLHVRRWEANGLEANGVDGKHLQHVIGQETEGVNRFAVGPLDAEDEGSPPALIERFVVKDDGNVGIGIASPETRLQIDGEAINSLTDHGLLVLGLRESENLSFDKTSIVARNDETASVLHLNTEGGHVIVSGSGDGKLGIGEPNPGGRLHIKGGSAAATFSKSSAALEIDHSGNEKTILQANGPTAPYRIALQDGHGRVSHLWNAYDSGSDHRYDVASEGAVWVRLHAGELAIRTAPDGVADGIVTWRLGLSQDSLGNVGIGRTNPQAPFHVDEYMAVGPFAASTGQGGIDVTGPLAELGFVKRTLNSWPAVRSAGDRFVWYNPNGTARLWTNVNGVLLTVKSNGDVGMGTTNPSVKLDVRGDIRLGDGVELYAPGCDGTTKIIWGKVSSAGNLDAGTGFTPHPGGTGEYDVDFDAGSYSGTPVVVVTPFDSPDEDNVPTIQSVSTAGFSVVMKSVGGENVRQSNAFTFIAIGPR